MFNLFQNLFSSYTFPHFSSRFLTFPPFFLFLFLSLSLRKFHSLAKNFMKLKTTVKSSPKMFVTSFSPFFETFSPHFQPKIFVTNVTLFFLYGFLSVSLQALIRLLDESFSNLESKQKKRKKIHQKKKELVSSSKVLLEA